MNEHVEYQRFKLDVLQSAMLNNVYIAQVRLSQESVSEIKWKYDNIQTLNFTMSKASIFRFIRITQPLWVILILWVALILDIVTVLLKILGSGA